MTFLFRRYRLPTNCISENSQDFQRFFSESVEVSNIDKKPHENGTAFFLKHYMRKFPAFF